MCSWSPVSCRGLATVALFLPWLSGLFCSLWKSTLPRNWSLSGVGIWKAKQTWQGHGYQGVIILPPTLLLPKSCQYSVKKMLIHILRILRSKSEQGWMPPRAAAYTKANPFKPWMRLRIMHSILLPNYSFEVSTAWVLQKNKTFQARFQHRKSIPILIHLKLFLTRVE